MANETTSASKMEERVRKYVEEARDSRLTRTASEITKEVDSSEENYRKAFKLFDFVKDEVPYNSKDSGLQRSPIETLREGGNCADQTVLLASLLNEIEVYSYIQSLANDEDDHHANLYIGFEREKKAEDELGNWYGDITFCSHKSEDMTWFISDPVYSEHVGDIKSLADDGFFYMKEGEYWKTELRAAAPLLT